MRKDLLPYYLRNITIRGFEDEEGEGEPPDPDLDEDPEDGEKEPKEKDKPENNDALKSALQKERAARKKAEREAKALAKFKEESESKDKSETEQAKAKAEKADAKTTKLASKLLTSAVDNAIIKAGSTLRFRDIDDALKLVDRGLIEVEQDDDDPAEIDLDAGSVKSALTALAKAKPHLIIADGQEEKSGSKFGGSRKTQTEIDDEALKANYPALNRSQHT